MSEQVTTKAEVTVWSHADWEADVLWNTLAAKAKELGVGVYVNEKSREADDA